MIPPVRQLLAAAAAAALLSVGATAGASADEVTSPAPSAACVEATAQLQAANDAAAVAKRGFLATNVPIGRALAAARTEARAEVRTSTAAIRRLLRESAGKVTHAERVALQAKIRAERADVRVATRLLTRPQALLASVKAAKVTARATWASTKTAQAAAQLSADTACAEPVEEPTDGTDVP